MGGPDTFHTKRGCNSDLDWKENFLLKREVLRVQSTEQLPPKDRAALEQANQANQILSMKYVTPGSGLIAPNGNYFKFRSDRIKELFTFDPNLSQRSSSTASSNLLCSIPASLQAFLTLTMVAA